MNQFIDLACPRVIKDLVLFSAFCFVSSCGLPNDPGPKNGIFETSPKQVSIAPGNVNEASGLAASRSMPGFLWTIQDSGNPPELFLLNSENGNLEKKFTLNGATNRDWEDIATGPGPEAGISYIYLADIGNNDTVYQNPLTIYRLPEVGSAAQEFDDSKLEKIQFKYPFGTRDAETILIDPVSKDIFMISKSLGAGEIYRLPFPQSTSEIITAEPAGLIPQFVLATGGSVSSDGSEIIIRSYTEAFYWRRIPGKSFPQTLGANPLRVPLAPEPQGEAISFDASNSGIYTLSELGNSDGVTLNFYRKK